MVGIAIIAKLLIMTRTNNQFGNSLFILLSLVTYRRILPPSPFHLRGSDGYS